MKRLFKLWALCTAAMLCSAFITGCGGGGGGGSDSPTVSDPAPTVVYTTPINNATDVGTNSKITVTFSEAVSDATITTGAFKLENITTGTPTTVTLSSVGYDTANKIATITPSAIVANQKYRVTVNPVVKDTTGNTMQSAYSWEFTTGAGADGTAPAVQSVAPTGASVAINSTIAITFSEPMDTNTVSNAFSLKQGSTGIPGTLRFVGQTAVFTPGAVLDYSKTYTATITTAAKDQAGNQITEFTWDFTTEPPPALDEVAPTSVPGSEFPTDQATGVPRDTPISVRFDEPITPFYYGAIDGAPTEVIIDYATNTVTMTPTTLLSANTTYRVTLRVTDLAGNQMPAVIQWEFTTGATPTSLP